MSGIPFHAAAAAAAAVAVAMTMVAACSKPANAPMKPVAEVTTTPAMQGDLPVTVTGYGVVQFDPAGQLTLTAEIEARVLGLDALPGDTVEQRAVLLSLGPSSSAGVEIARARRDAVLAKSTAERTQRLRADGLASDADVQSAANAAKNQAALAESLEARAANLSSLRAPMSGVIDAMLVGPGDLVAPGSPLVRMASPNKIQAKVGVEIEDAARLKPGAPVRLSSLDSAETVTDSEIRMIDYRVDPATRMSTVLVSIPRGRGLLSGEAVRAEITAEVRRGVVIVPRQSIFTDDSGPYVFVENEGKASLRRIQTGPTAGSLTEVGSGLSAGETIIVEGAATLSDGMRVRNAQPHAGPKP